MLVNCTNTAGFDINITEFQMIKAINQKIDEKVPYERRSYTKTTKIRTAIREEHIKTARYFRGKSPQFAPFSCVFHNL
jgi:hypothetical protein